MSVQWGGVPCPAKCSTWRTGLLVLAAMVVAMADDRSKWEGKAGRAFERAEQGCSACKTEGINYIAIVRKYRDGEPIRYQFEPGSVEQARRTALQYHDAYKGLTVMFVPVRGEMGYGSFDMEEKARQ